MTTHAVGEIRSPDGVDDNFDDISRYPALAERPSITNRYYHLIRELKKALQPAVSALTLPPGARVLDYGCSTMRHRHMFPADVEYEGADLPGNPRAHIDLLPDGRIPAANDRYDVVFSTQVLEHVDDPVLYLGECRRVLKPGGRLLLSTHGTFAYHACPNDYWRWTHTGLQHAVTRAGFRVVEFKAICGALPSALQLLQDIITKKLPRFLRPLFQAVIQLLMVATDALYKPQQKLRNATFYLITAEVPDAE